MSDIRQLPLRIIAGIRQARVFSRGCCSDRSGRREVHAHITCTNSEK